MEFFSGIYFGLKTDITQCLDLLVSSFMQWLFEKIENFSDSGNFKVQFLFPF